MLKVGMVAELRNGERLVTREYEYGKVFFNGEDTINTDYWDNSLKHYSDFKKDIVAVYQNNKKIWQRSKIKNCKCSGKSEVVEIKEGSRTLGFLVKCTKCNNYKWIFRSPTEDEAVKKWNSK